MKHVFSVLSVTCIAFFTLFLSTTNVSCKKGDTGPKGDTGIANMTYSAWLNVQYQPVRNTAGDTVYFEAKIPAPKITDSVLLKGDVRVFANNGTAAQPQILALPFGYSIIPFIEKGNITLQGDDDWGTYTTGGQTFWQYRYIILQGTIPARSAVNWNDYNAVKEYYKIPD